MDSTYEAALKYIYTYGFSLVKLPPLSKGLFTEGWNKKENVIDTLDKADVFRREPNCNVGVVLQFSNLVSFDIDNEEYTRQIFYVFGLDYDELLEKAPRIVGRPGHDKALFRAPANVLLSTHKLQWPNREGTGYITIFELRAGAVQDVLPPSMHPDTGVPYTWKRSLEQGIPELPQEILSFWKEWNHFAPQFIDVCQWAPERKPEPPKKARNNFGSKREGVIKKFNDSNDIRDLLKEYGYIKKGSRFLAPGSTTKIPGVVTTSENRCYSHHGSDVLGDGHTHDCFDLFTTFEHFGDLKEAVLAAEKMFNIERIEYDPEAIEHGKTVVDRFTKKHSVFKDDDLLHVPGILQHAVDYYQETATKPQIEYAVACALAIGSVCMGRQWKTNQNNYTGLYFLVIGKSSTGKEHSKTVIETILRMAGESCFTLIGPPNYTSAGAIITTLKVKPRHICIQDEMGKQLQHAMSSRNSQKDAAYTMIMEAFGRQAGFLSSDAYSMLAGKQHDNGGLGTTIERPSITIFGISTPTTLYKAINTESISSGYLPRFLIIESLAEREVSRWIENDIYPHAELLDWCKKCAEKTGESGNISAYTDPPEPHKVMFHPDCRAMLEQFERDIIKIQNGLDAFGISELWGKTKEISQRIALIIAVSCESDIILPEHLDWSIRYTKKHFSIVTERVKGVVSDSNFEATCKEVLTIIQQSGLRGVTRRELHIKSGLVRALDTKGRDAILSTLQESYGIREANISHNGGGRPRIAWIMADDES